MVKPLSKQSAKGSGLVDRSLSLRARSSAGNTWLSSGSSERDSADRTGETQPLEYRVLETEEQVGQAMLDEIRHAWRQKQQDLVIVLLGGRGAQSLHRQLGELAAKGTEDRMLASLKVFTQDALAPMRMDNSFSFVRDFERLLGNEFFAKVKVLPRCELMRSISRLSWHDTLRTFRVRAGSTSSFWAMVQSPAERRILLTLNRTRARAPRILQA